MTANRLSTRYYSHKQEKQIEDTFNGKCTPNSGATPFIKGDVVIDNILVECKTSIKDSNSFSVKKQVLEKLKKEAFSNGKYYSTLCFNFGPTEKKNYFVIDENLFNILVNSLKDL